MRTEREIATRYVEISAVLVALIDEWSERHTPTSVEDADCEIRVKVRKYFELMRERARWINAATNFGLHRVIDD